MLVLHGDELLTGNGAVTFAQTCVGFSGVGDKVEVSLDRTGEELLISGPDYFGFLGTVTYRSLRLRLPTSRVAVALCVARHVLGDLDLLDREVYARLGELPLALAVLLSGGDGA